MEQYLNKEYKFVTSENLDEFLIFINTPFLIRKAVSVLKPSHILTKNDDGSYTFAFISNIAKSNITFKLGEEFEEIKPAGDKAQTIITFEGHKMIMVSKRAYDGILSKNVFEYFPAKLVETITAEGFDKIVTTTYELVH